MAIPTSNDSGIFGDINITPLTDIFLVLLIIFMVGAAVAIESAAHVGLPKSKAVAPNQKPDAITVRLTAQRSIFVNGQEVGLNDLQPALHQAIERSHDKLVIFKGDPSIILGDMVIILDVAKRAGARQLGVAVAQNGDTTTVDVPRDTP